MPDWLGPPGPLIELIVKLLTAFITLVNLVIKLKETTRNEKEAPRRPKRKGH